MKRERHYINTVTELTGTIEVKQGGFGFLRDDGGDVFIPASGKNGALSGDAVVVRLSTDNGPRDREGEVVRIVRQADVVVPGTVRVNKRRMTVEPDDRRVPEVYIGKAGKVPAGSKVMVRVLTRSTGYDSPTGEIAEVLGRAGERGVDVLCVARTFGLTADFPAEVHACAAAANVPVSGKDTDGREDFRGIKVFTIDGDDSKDFDDAVSVVPTDGGFEVGVHIADVSHYVTPGSATDAEALRRGTSAYLSDSVIPMLPVELSNGICSLNPGVDRLTLSCVMRIDGGGNITDYRIVPGVIRSCHRLTYREVNRCFAGDSAAAAKLGDVRRELDTLNTLAKKLRGLREAQGSIDFEIDESAFTLDGNGRAIDVYVRERGDAEKLIEEFMLAANRTVAAEYFYRELPFVYRVHKAPASERLHELTAFLAGLGYNLHTGGSGVKAGDIARILESVSGTPEAAVVNRVILRSMQKAVYSPECGGHFGLGFTHYCHFTSPIRRYPDLACHRIIKQTLAGTLDIEAMEEQVAGISEQSSERERNAMEAERKMDDIKRCEYMSAHLGEQFTGVVSGVTNSAMFVELPNTCEGVIPLNTMEDDYYEYDDKHMRLTGEHTGKVYTLGSRVDIIVASASPEVPRTQFCVTTDADSDTIER